MIIHGQLLLFPSRTGRREESMAVVVTKKMDARASSLVFFLELLPTSLAQRCEVYESSATTTTTTTTLHSFIIIHF